MQNPQYRFRETISLGTTSLTSQQASAAAINALVARCLNRQLFFTRTAVRMT